MKKRLIFSLSFLFLVAFFLFLAPALVSAYNGFGPLDLRQGAENLINLVVDFAEPFFQVLLGGEDYTGLLLFERFLIFILILSIVYIAMRNIPIFEDQKGVIWTISIIVPLLAVRFIDFAWLNTIIIQYKVLGIALTGILPFIIYLFFLHSVSESNVVRKIGWIFFIIVYFGLWSTTETETYGQIYFWTMLVALVFLLLDGTIHRALQRQKWRESERGPIYNRIADIDSEIKRIRESAIPLKKKRGRIRELEKERKRLHKTL